MLGFSGAQRTGKSTLAKRAAELFERPYLDMDISSVFRKTGFDPKADYSFADRLDLQSTILAYADDLWFHAPPDSVTDRTPLDFAAYLLADVQRQNTSIEDAERYMRFERRCMEVTNRYFSDVIVVQPGIPLVEKEGGAPANPAHMAHINYLIRGMGASELLETQVVLLAKSLIDFDARVQTVVKIIESMENKAIKQAEAAFIH